MASRIGRRATGLVQNGIITAVARRDFPQINRGKSCSQFVDTLTHSGRHVKPKCCEAAKTLDGNWQSCFDKTVLTKVIAKIIVRGVVNALRLYIC